MPHALKVQGGKGGGGGRLWARGALSCGVAAGDQAPRDVRPLGLTTALCRPHRKYAAQGVFRGGVQSLQRAGSISREAGRERERRCRGGEGHGRMEGNEDGGRSPFPGSPGPALSQWRHALHPQSPRQSQLPPLPTCPAVPFLQAPSPVPSSTPSGNPPSSHSTSPEGQGNRNGTWVQSTDGMTKSICSSEATTGTHW